MVSIATISLTGNYSNRFQTQLNSCLDYYKSLLPQYPLPYITYPPFSKKLQGIEKGKKKQSEETKAIIRTRLKYDIDPETKVWAFKIIVIKGSNEKDKIQDQIGNFSRETETTKRIN